MRIELVILSVCLLLLTLPGCRHGTTDTSRIHGVSPTGVAGAPGAIIEFSIDFDATGTATFAWNFDHGAEPATSTAESPTVTLQDPGTYDAYVELRVDDTLVQHFDFEYTVASPPEITAVTPESDAGLVRGIVRFEAVFEGDFDALEWEFGDGATVREQDGTAAEVRLRDPGIYTGAVRSVYGTASSDDFPFEYTVTAPVAPSWTTQDIALAELSTSKNGVSVTEHLGRLAIAFTAPDGLRLALAKTTTPCCPADWDVHLIDPLGAVRSSQALISQDSRLMVAYRQYRGTDTAQLKVAVAQTAEPQSAEDWITMQIGFTLVGEAALLKREGETPVIVFGGVPSGLNFGMASVNLPETAEDWDIHALDPAPYTFLRLHRQLTMREWITGYEIAATAAQEFGGVTILFAQTAEHTPTSSADWPHHTADSTPTNGGTVSILPTDDDQPALLYAGKNEPSYIGLKLVQLHALTATPESESDWRRQQLPFDLAIHNAGFAITVAERALYVHADSDNNQFQVFRQVRERRGLVASWEASEIAGGNLVGIAMALFDYDGRIGLAFLDSNNGRLRLSLSSGPY